MNKYLMENDINDEKNFEKLKKLSDIEKEYKHEIEKKHVIEAFGKVQTFPNDLQVLWKKRLEKEKESITFNDSNVTLKSKSGYIYTSVSELLIAGYIYKFYLNLMTYNETISKLRVIKGSKLANEKTFAKAVLDAKTEKKGNLVNEINNAPFSLEDKKKLLEFTTDYDIWGGGKTIDRKTDFWMSPIYKVLNFVQSRSGLHSYITYFNDNKELYDATKDECIKALNLFETYCNGTSNASSLKAMAGENVIYYGVPGTGKSYAVNKEIKKAYPEYEMHTENSYVYRVTLYPDYSYTDFVGQILPQSDETQNIKYKFTAGIFTTALKQAIYEPDKPVYLVLEELSRANVAAVFGDVFQLLDRKKGISEYPINNSDIAEEVYGNKFKKVFIPHNLNILCTVNTSDQNVYPMDTAFKRRFEWKYIATDSSLKEDDYFQKHNNPKINIGNNVKVEWKDLYQGLNKFIVGNLQLSEDKQIGPFFIKFENADEKCARTLVQNKLLQYLWEDVESTAIAMHSSNISLFLDRKEIPSFSTLYTKFKNKDTIFSSEFLETLRKSNET